jgi:hypothetical protein
MTISNTTIWNSATAGTDIAISNGLQVYATANPPADQWCLTTDSITGGQQTYFEITVNSLYGNDSGIGICNASASAAGLANNATYGCMVYGSYLNNGTVYLNGHEITTSQIGTFASNTTICVAVSGQAVYFRKGAAGQWMGNTNTANPTTNTGGAVLTVDYPWYVVSVFSGFGTPQNYTANFGNTAFSGINPFVSTGVTQPLVGFPVDLTEGLLSIFSPTPAVNPLTGFHINLAEGLLSIFSPTPAVNPLTGFHINLAEGLLGIPAQHAQQGLVGYKINLTEGKLYGFPAREFLTGYNINLTEGLLRPPFVDQPLVGYNINLSDHSFGIVNRVITLQGYNINLSDGLFQSAITAPLVGYNINLSQGVPAKVTYAPGMSMTNLKVVANLDNNNNEVALRVSYNKGVSFGVPMIQTLGEPGQYRVNVSFRRLGIGRDVVFELSWSTSGYTSLTGAFISVSPAGT